MRFRKFIFSEDWRVHIFRHLAFWFFWFIYFGLLHAANPMGLQEVAYFKNIPYAMTESFVMLTPHLILTYTMLLFVLPRYLMHGKYFTAYSNLTSIKVQRGTQVNAGTVLGNADKGDDGDGQVVFMVSNSNGGYLNPESWLGPR